MIVASVVGMLEHISERGAYARVVIVVRGIVAEIRAGKCGKVVWCAQLGHAIGYRCGERRAGV